MESLVSVVRVMFDGREILSHREFSASISGGVLFECLGEELVRDSSSSGGSVLDSHRSYYFAVRSAATGEELGALGVDEPLGAAGEREVELTLVAWDGADSETVAQPLQDQQYAFVPVSVSNELPKQKDDVDSGAALSAPAEGDANFVAVDIVKDIVSYARSMDRLWHENAEPKSMQPTLFKSAHTAAVVCCVEGELAESDIHRIAEAASEATVIIEWLPGRWIHEGPVLRLRARCIDGKAKCVGLNDMVCWECDGEGRRSLSNFLDNPCENPHELGLKDEF